METVRRESLCRRKRRGRVGGRRAERRRRATAGATAFPTRAAATAVGEAHADGGSGGEAEFGDADEIYRRRPPFPFVCIGGQEAMRRALLVNAVDPAVGGVILLGDRGTGKSIAVKAMADIMPDVEIVQGDPYNSHPSVVALMGPEARARLSSGENLAGCSARVRVPLVEIPLGSTEDRVCGTINMEQMFTSGKKGFVPGLLAEANQGILYIDEVNLLEDGLVDLILDSAAGGWNTVEREGVSVGHPAKFMLVGSGITQNGEMRPQLLDRFGLSVNVSTILDREVRIRNAVNRIAYDTDPFAFYGSVREEMDALKAKVARARAMLSDVVLPTKLQLQISQCCAALDVGLRADLTTVRAACALAALDGRLEASVDDVGKVIELAVAHRMPKDPLEPIEANIYRCRAKFKRIFGVGDDNSAEDRDGVTHRSSAEASAIGQGDQGQEKKKEEEVKEDKRAGLKAGAWSGPPGLGRK